jgi:hypothetical protein
MTKEFVAFTRLDASDVNAYLVNRPLQNAIINGAFEINQRNFTSTTTGTYGHDRWFLTTTGGTSTYSTQAFTLGDTPATGYQPSNFARVVVSGQSAAGDRSSLLQRIESVRTLAGETVTFSFFAKAGSGTPSISVDFAQTFGSGGSPSTAVTEIGATKWTLSTSWQRFSTTFTIPTLTGKTLGTSGTDNLLLTFWLSAGSDFNARSSSLGIQSNTFDIWGVQLEAGSVANPFRRNANSIQGELAACQRYYRPVGTAVAAAVTAGPTLVDFGVDVSTMRASPSSVFLTGPISITPTSWAGASTQSSAAASIPIAQPNYIRVRLSNFSGLTGGAIYFIESANSIYLVSEL